MAPAVVFDVVVSPHLFSLLLHTWKHKHNSWLCKCSSKMWHWKNKSYTEAPRITWNSSPRQLSLESTSIQTSHWKREMGLIQSMGKKRRFRLCLKLRLLDLLPAPSSSPGKGGTSVEKELWPHNQPIPHLQSRRVFKLSLFLLYLKEFQQFSTQRISGDKVYPEFPPPNLLFCDLQLPQLGALSPGAEWVGKTRSKSC